MPGGDEARGDDPEHRRAGVVVGDDARHVGPAAAQPAAADRAGDHDADEVQAAGGEQAAHEPGRLALHRQRVQQAALEHRRGDERRPQPGAAQAPVQAAQPRARALRDRSHSRQPAYVPGTLAEEVPHLARRSRRDADEWVGDPDAHGTRKGEHGDQPHGTHQRSQRSRRERARAPDARGPRRPAARDAHDARRRGARDEPLPPGQGSRLLLRRLRPGGRVGRRRVGDGRRGPPLRPASRPRRAHGPRRQPVARSSASTWAAPPASRTGATATCTSATAARAASG